MLTFSQMVLKRPERFVSLPMVAVTSWQARECGCFSSTAKQSLSIFLILLSLSSAPVQGCEGWVVALRGCSFTVTYPWPLLKGLHIRRDPAEWSYALVLGSSTETFLFPGVNWCFVGWRLKPPLKPRNRRDRLQPPPAHDSGSLWCSVHWSLLPLAGHCEQRIIPWQQGHCNMQAPKLQRLLHSTAK